MMLQQEAPSDYVIGTGESHSVEELARVACEHAGIDFESHVRIDPTLLRPAEVDDLVADPAKARRELGWAPRTSFEELVCLMVDADLERLRKGAPLVST